MMNTYCKRLIGLVLLTAAFLGVLPSARAQETHERFTLTNGNLYWMSSTTCDENYMYPIAYDRSNGWAEVHPFGTENQITHMTKQGDVYLALDITETGTAANPKLVARKVSDGFTPYCVWSRTGSTGYYYQRWGTKRYYLLGTPRGLQVVVKDEGDPVDDVNSWYNWDFGAGITHVTYRDNVRTETTHWIYYDTVGTTGVNGDPSLAHWTMTPEDSYERPEVIYYTEYTPGADALNEQHRRYYYGYLGSDDLYHAYGNAALFMPVKQIDHAVEIDEANADPSYGLKSVYVNNYEVADREMRFDDDVQIRPYIEYTSGTNLTRPVSPAYTEYVEETERCGIHLNYLQRKTETFGSKGIGTSTTYYYQDGVRQLAAPASVNRNLTVASVTYSINAEVRRYLEMYATDPSSATTHDLTVNSANPIHLHCYSIPDHTLHGTLTLVVKYRFTEGGTEYYVTDTATQAITVSNYSPKGDDRTPTLAPVVYGYVFGGGRMANVGYDNGSPDPVNPTNDVEGGNPSITIHNADTLYAIYGGNDIAGWVQGTAVIQVGTTGTKVPLRVGYMYGGGCGYYSYENAHDAVTGSNAGAGVLTDNVGYGQYCFNGKVYKWKAGAATEENLVVDKNFTYTPFSGDDWAHGEKGQSGDGTVPYIKSAHIKIGAREETGVVDYAERERISNLIQIDSVFGGGENSFIGIDGDLFNLNTALTVEVYGGTIMSLYGGNNYGGSVAKKSTTKVTIYNTTKSNDYDIVNSRVRGYGRDFGIRHVFGGGNMVESAHAEVTIHGGMVDTCFVGGNRASVVQPVGTIDCRGENFIYENPSIEDIVTAARLTDETIDEANWNKFLEVNPGAYLVNHGRYNVRAFFGGNNKAPMDNLSYIHLASGGVCYVYGGGNEGDMNNATHWDDGYYRRYSNGATGTDDGFDEDNLPVGVFKILDFGDSVRGSLSGNGWIYDMPLVFGSMVNSPAESRIIVENIYGGCRKANVKYSSGLSISGGVFGYVQGGNDISGDVGSDYVTEGSWVIIDSNAVVLQEVYGGSDGYYHCHQDGIYLTEDMLDNNHEPYDYYHEYVGLPIPTQNNSNLYIHGGNILLAAYGGGVMCDIGYKEGVTYYKKYDNLTGTFSDLEPAAGRQNGMIHLQISGGTIGSAYWHPNAVQIDGAEAKVTASELKTKLEAAKLVDELAYDDGNAYGGSFLSSLYGLCYYTINSDTRAADPAEHLHTKIYGSVYGGNDCMGGISSFGKYKMPGVDPSDPGAYDVTASSGMAVNGAGKALYDAYVRIEGSPRISCVYGSGNGAYDYDGTRPEFSSEELVCQDVAGDNRPFQSSTLVDVHTSGGLIDTVFGGGNGVGVRENAMVLLNTTSKYNTTRADSLFVGTIFGGNNRDDMNTCVPDIILKQGTVANVYGGGNAGNMKGIDMFTDICGREVDSVSTYVKVEEPNVYIQQNLFGGCRMADVKGMAYVDIRNTDVRGINYVYGGNDISGNVTGNTRVDMCGGYVNHIYGGSNGYYDYVTYSDQNNNDSIVVWNFGSDQAVAENMVAPNSTGEPNVSATHVNIFGGTVRSSVFGGGRMGDCDTTYVVVNDTVCGKAANGLIQGSVFGGGEGNYEDLNAPRRGNVIDETHVDLYHIADLTDAKAYGGGKGGDVYRTHITVHEDWDVFFEEIYGGCWGSDVYGTANLTMDGQERGSAQNALAVFGGNDFTGNVHTVNLTINSGHYGAIYGAGNGNYLESEYTSGVYSDADKNLHVPNAEYVNVTFNDGVVDSNLYGGGRLGTTMKYQKDENHVHLLDANGHFIPDTLTSCRPNYIGVDGVVTAYSDPLDYSYTIVNVHGGTFYRNIFAGAAGDDKQLVYGLKVLNMDGGDVRESIYGGSEKVHDGYGSRFHTDALGEIKYYEGECISADSTTMRPSSILNLAAGRIQGNVYGGGYMGNVFGSVYVNVGLDAIENSKVWTSAFQTSYSPARGSAAGAYAIFKPNSEGSLSPNLTADGKWLYMDKSIYGGANWGMGTGNYIFDARGFYGGENRILVDGNGYKTKGTSAESTYPEMNINLSIIGSGTSALGGDVLSRIDVMNYGAEGDDCHATKKLYSIQRADSVWLWNTGIYYLGTSSAASAYPSAEVTFNIIKSLNMRGYNVVEIKAQMSNVEDISYYENDPDGEGHLVLTTPAELTVTSTDQCDNYSDMCQKLDVVDPDTKKYTALVVNDGVNVDVIKSDGTYGDVHGFAYLLAQNGTNAVVTAKSKLSDNTTSGGFMSFCSDSNMYHRYIDDHVTEWDNSPSGTGWSSTEEYPYENYGNGSSYRVWSVGKGTRTRYAVILAHANPNILADDKTIKVTTNDGVYHNLSLAHAQLILPPSEPGNYYKISDAGIITKDDNNELLLTDSTWNPVNWEAVQNDAWTTPESVGEWTLAGAVGNNHSGSTNIEGSPNNSFGLLLASGQNFETSVPGVYVAPDGHTGTWNNGLTVLTGNSNVNVQNSFWSAKVGDNANTTPIMDLYLTYDNDFANTMLATVQFTLDEYNSEGTLVGTVKTFVTIATIIESFKNIEEDVLAMFNEGRTNEFVRKVVLPATLQHRDVYLTGITWYPTDLGGTGQTFTPDAEAGYRRFSLTDQPSTILNETAPNVFRVSLEPSDNITSTVNSNIGWHAITNTELDAYTQMLGRIGTDTVIDVSHPYGTEVNPIVTGGIVSYTGSPSNTTPTTVNLKTGDADSKTGVKVGELDGRGMAALNIKLNYDGNKIYPEVPSSHYVGKVIFTLESWIGVQSMGTFTITAYVKTRACGDTIYLASANEVQREVCIGEVCSTYTVHPAEPRHWTVNGNSNDDEAGDNFTLGWIKNNVGKHPGLYVQDFTQAFSPLIYEEGDVIAIIDEVDIPSDQQVAIHGSAYFPATVIRYDGHHYELPGEASVYRGTMINVADNSSFSATDVTFCGSSLGKLTDVVFRANSGNTVVVSDSTEQYTNGPCYHPDTNYALGPILASSGNASSIYLGNNVSVIENYNVYDGSDPTKYGAINISNGAKLYLQNAVTVEKNISKLLATAETDHPTNGAVFLNNGKIVMEDSYSMTQVSIMDNYLMPDPSAPVTFWTNFMRNGNLVRYDFDNSNLLTTGLNKANVLLARTEPASGDANFLAMKDVLSDYIELDEFNMQSLPAATRIGISKWFPGPYVRDTIRVVYGKNSTQLIDAFTNTNFRSDNPAYDVFYNYYVSGNEMFLHRCASFRHQVAGVGIFDLEDRLASVVTDDVLSYLYDPKTTCPTGLNDSIVYRVQGGFMPYTYTWKNTTSGKTLRTYNTVVTNAKIQDEINVGNLNNYKKAISDTMAVPAVTLGHEITSTEELTYTVTAVDAVGCELTKDIDVTVKRSANTDIPFAKIDVDVNGAMTDGWTDTASAVVANKATAKGERTLKGVQIVPMVWADRNSGIIFASAPNDLIYLEDASTENHDFQNLIFCEGEEIVLATAPSIGTDNKFIMWDFDPYYTPRVRYVVPSFNDTVIAFYGPNSYWREVVNTTDKAGGLYYDQYYYEPASASAISVPTYTMLDGSDAEMSTAGYVTTYLGDVHIYNENGLAWFISVVNGLNGTQSRAFFFNKVYLHKKSDGTDYDMKAHLWTPVGTPQHRFRGSFIGTSSTLADTAAAATPVVIKNIVVDEPNVNYCGFFGFLDEATIKSIELNSAMIRGAQYVGAMAANATRTRIADSKVSNQSDDANTVIVTHYASGGMVGKTDHSFIESSSTNAKYVGDAVYTGGMVGTGVSTTVVNSVIIDNNRMESVYAGGVGGSLTDTSSVEEPSTYTVIAYSADETMGKVWIYTDDNEYEGLPNTSLTLDAGTSITLDAQPEEWVGSDDAIYTYYFDHWSDGSTQNPYQIEALSENINMVAYFTQTQPEEYTVNVTIDPANTTVEAGWVNGGGTYRATTADGVQVTLEAIANENAGYVFSSWSWSDATGVAQTGINNPLTLQVTGDINVIAHFEQQGINPGGNKRGRKDVEDHRNYIQNNYVRFNTKGGNQRVGGLVGYAENTTIENNYVYGSLQGQATEAGVGAVIDHGTQANHNYYEHSAVSRSVGQTRGGASATENTSFAGQGNQVTLATPTYGVNNLTRALNLWVREHGNRYKTWRSDLEGNNNGYPMFGAPDMIPVHDSLVVSGCDSVEWDGTVYLFDDEVVSHVVDSVMMVDSTNTLRIVVHHSSREQYSDSVSVGESYSGYGFELTETEVALLMQGSHLTGNATFVFTDTLQSESGCDSIVTLMLTVSGNSEAIEEVPTEMQIRIYPNPTTSRVTIESSEAMSHVELFDNEGRRLQDYRTYDRENITIDVSNYPTGAYYLRVHTAGNVTIQKLIKK